MVATMTEEFEDIKWVIRIRNQKAKDTGILKPDSRLGYNSVGYWDSVIRTSIL